MTHANGGTPTLDNIADMVGSYENANGSIDEAVFVCSPRSWTTLRKVKDSKLRYQLNAGGNGVVQAVQRSLFGIPVLTSTNVGITETVGSSTDCSYVLLVDRSQLAIGYGTREGDLFNTIDSIAFDAGLGIELAYSGGYAFNADQTAIRVVSRFDIQPLNVTSVVVMTGVRP